MNKKNNYFIEDIDKINEILSIADVEIIKDAIGTWLVHDGIRALIDGEIYNNIKSVSDSNGLRTTKVFLPNDFHVHKFRREKFCIILRCFVEDKE